AVTGRAARVVLADAGAGAGAEARAALPDEDHPRHHVLAGEHLHAEHLRVRVAPVARRSKAFLVRHQPCSFPASADSRAAIAPLRFACSRSYSSAASRFGLRQLAACSEICTTVISS